MVIVAKIRFKQKYWRSIETVIAVRLRPLLKPWFDIVWLGMEQACIKPGKLPPLCTLLLLSWSDSSCSLSSDKCPEWPAWHSSRNDTPEYRWMIGCSSVAGGLNAKCISYWMDDLGSNPDSELFQEWMFFEVKYRERPRQKKDQRIPIQILKS